MSECVVRMEMPKGCGYCRIAQFGYCGITHEPVADAYMGYPENRPKTCPILAVLPEPHGRLVDADALLAKWKKDCTYEKCLADCFDCQFPVAIEELENAPTIVPAERSEHEAD